MYFHLYEFAAFTSQLLLAQGTDPDDRTSLRTILSQSAKHLSAYCKVFQFSQPRMLLYKGWESYYQDYSLLIKGWPLCRNPGT